MKLRLPVIILIGPYAFGQFAIAEDTIRNGDVIIVSGFVEHCEDMGQFVGWRNRVIDNELEINGHMLPVAGPSSQSLYESLSRLLGPGLGTPLSDVSVTVMSSDDSKHNGIDLCKEGRLTPTAIEAREFRLNEHRERQKDVAAAANNRSSSQNAHCVDAG